MRRRTLIGLNGFDFMSWRSSMKTQPRLTGGASLLLIPVLTLSAVGFFPLTVSAAAEQIVMGMPFAGRWAYNVPTTAGCGPGAQQTAHPSCHELYGYQWGVDYYAADGTDVKLNGTSTQGGVSFSSTAISGQSCGEGLTITAKVGNTEVGQIYATHLADSVVSASLANEAKIGTVYDGGAVYENKGCYKVDHVHFSYKNTVVNHSCYKNYSVANGNTAGMDIAYGAAVGVLGSASTGVQEACSSIPGGGSTPPTFKMTSSAEDAPMAGDLNGDGYGDAVMVHKHAADNGADVHVQFGAAGGLQSPTYVTTLATGTWDWNRMKFAVGKFNSDPYADLAIVYKQGDGGAAVHVFYGAPGPGLPLQTFTTQRTMDYADGWNWDQMKIVSGDFNADGADDLAIGAKRPSDGGMGIHVLTGGAGVAALANPPNTTSWRDLPGPAWLWSNIKLASGPFNGDNSADLAVIYNNAGINIHILNGGPEKFGNTFSNMQSLPSSAGWDWSLVKPIAGQFNDDVYADLVMLHKRSDGGMAAHTFYGSNGMPFQIATLPARDLLGSTGWSWDMTKLAAGPTNGDNWSDIVLLHRNNTQDIDTHVLYGNPGTSMFSYNPTLVNSSPGPAWNWYMIKTSQ